MMQIKDVMTRDVEVVSPRTTLREAADKMRELDVGVMPVCDGDRLQGIITDRDITIRATAQGSDPNRTPVEQVMTPDAVCCTVDQDVREAAEMMQQHQIRRLPIIDSNQRLVGIVSLGDLAVDTNQRIAGDVIEDVSRPSRPDR